MEKPPRFTSIDEYLESLPHESRVVIEEIRSVVRDNLPGAIETISYQLPAFKLDRVFIVFAAFKQHIGIYPPVKGDARLQKALLPYRGEKGNLRFPLSEPMPYDLIGRIAVALSQERSTIRHARK